VNLGPPDTPTLGKTYTGTGFLGISWEVMVRQRNRCNCPRRRACAPLRAVRL